MKKIIFIILAIFIGFSCKDFNEDNFDWYEDAERPTNVANYELTMTDADYATIVSALRANKNAADSALATKLNTAKMFSEELDPASLLPYLLSSKYLAMDVNSSAKVTHLYNSARDTVVARLSQAGYILSTNDYKLAWNEEPFPNSFTPDVLPETHLPEILKQNFADATDNSYKTVEYFYSEETPVASNVEGEVYLYETFESYTKDADAIIDGWINHDQLTTTKKWQIKEFTSNKYLQLYTSSSGSDKNDVWMITPKIDLTNSESPYLSFDITTAYWKHDGLTILVSKNFDGNASNISSATWDNITDLYTIPQTPTSGYGTLAPAGIGSLSNYKGESNVYIAFRYQGDATTTPQQTSTFQIDNVKICEIVRGLDVENKTKMYASYIYKNGSWAKADASIITLQTADYLPFGITSGIMTTSQAAEYLPQFLAKNYYGTEGSEKVVVYQTKAGVFYADRYKYTGGVWVLESFIEEITTPFAYAQVDGIKQWIYDPTIIIPVTKDDYQLVVDYVKEHFYEGNEGVWDTRGNAEYYYGFSQYYGNISYREAGYRNKDNTFPIDGTQEEKVEFMNKRTKEGLAVLLTLKYPDATPVVNGVDQKARFDNIIIYYEPDAATNVTWTYTFQCTGDKEWKFVSRESNDGRSEEASE